VSPFIQTLPVLVVNPYSRCNCRCTMCDIWQGTDTQALSREVLQRQLASVTKLKIQWVVFSGGEPLMHPDIFQLCEIAKGLGARVTMLSTGILLARYAKEIITHVDGVIVSLDGPEGVHDLIRRVPGAYQTLASGIERLRELKSDFQISGRCTVQRSNCESLLQTVAAARILGLDSISFLAVDVHSTAFNRPDGLSLFRQSGLLVGVEQIPLLESQIESIIEAGHCGGLVAESPAKLRRIAHYFRSYASLSRFVAPACNAPWTSAVLEANGEVRPCFFHPAFGTLSSGADLMTILNSQQAVEFRATLDVASNPICRRCVCSLNWDAGKARSGAVLAPAQSAHGRGEKTSRLP
jgi:MoaA/NifB/PqqE/SkfB family radical SAM enzyme